MELDIAGVDIDIQLASVIHKPGSAQSIVEVLAVTQLSGHLLELHIVFVEGATVRVPFQSLLNQLSP